MRRTLLKFWGIVMVCSVLAGCSFEKLGQNAGTGVVKSLSPGLDSIGRNLVATIRTELVKDSSQEQLKKFIDSILAPAMQSIRNTVGSSRDSIINQKTLVWVDSLLQAVTGDKLNHNLMAIQSSFMGKTKTDIYQVEYSIKQLIAEMLGDSTRIRLGLLRNELLGDKTTKALNTIIDTAVSHIVDSSIVRLSKRLKSDIDPVFQGDVSFVRKNAVALLISLAALAAVIIFLIWRNRRKYLQMLTLVAKQIHDIPDQKVYDVVTTKIKNEAVTAGLEPKLREVLNDNGLLSSESWKKAAS